MKSKISFALAILLAVALIVVMLAAGEIHSTVMKISGLDCQGCAKEVTEALESISGVESVKVNLEKGSVQVKYISANLSDLENTLLALGFEVNNKKPTVTHGAGGIKNKTVPDYNIRSHKADEPGLPGEIRTSRRSTNLRIPSGL